MRPKARVSFRSKIRRLSLPSYSVRMDSLAFSAPVQGRGKKMQMVQLTQERLGR
jgi:hypothetical protein